MKIGLTHTENKEKHQFYIEWLRLDDKPDIVSLSVEADNAEEVKRCDALVLSGGVDIHPSFYDGAEEYPNMPSNGWRKDRDLFERSAFAYAIQSSIPIFGICRGMQFINVILNGTLTQDLGDQALNKVHKGGPDKRHEVIIERDSLLHEITGLVNGEVNSAHHQSIKRIGHGLMVNCRAIDGTIEGIEWMTKHNKPFLLGVQWHPERMFGFNLQDSPLSAAIRNKFIEEVSKSKASKK
ncbi:MAG TPA: gamma-glutamyl-gamma-aminobutyrate hydrolase family protein [Chitinophagaceae bacterium]